MSWAQIGLYLLLPGALAITAVLLLERYTRWGDVDDDEGDELGPW